MQLTFSKDFVLGKILNLRLDQNFIGVRSINYSL